MQDSNYLIGRKEELKILERIYRSSKAEFVAIYGRRRVGKTFLVRSFFKDKGVLFEVTGSYKSSNEAQLKNFYTVFKALFQPEESAKSPNNWQEALVLLLNEIKKIDSKQKIILFFDELPWLSSVNSDFLSSFEHMWNRYLSTMPNVKLIVCGSAASWMITNVINNTGGLYQRLSYHLRLMPFNLSETEEYLKANHIILPRKQICEIYMVTGGVPTYLSYLIPGLSVAQNIDNLCFKPQSPLITEFHYLYYALFDDASSHLKVVEALAHNRYGLSRKELLKEAKLSSSGSHSRILQELEESGFIASFPQVGKKSKEKQYYLIDAYSYFYFKWIEPDKTSILNGLEKDYWLKQQTSQAWKSWSGYAFESICLMHALKIKEALQIGSVSTKCGYWKSVDNGKKQIEIDLVIDRADNCINLCEIKFHKDEFVIDQTYAKKLNQKKELFQKNTGTKKALFITLITPFGCKENNEYVSLVTNQLTFEDLF